MHFLPTILMCLSVVIALRSCSVSPSSGKISTSYTLGTASVEWVSFFVVVIPLTEFRVRDGIMVLMNSKT